MNPITSLLHERSKRVAPADRNALAYLYNTPHGMIEIGPEHDHDAEHVRALVQRLHPCGLVRGRAKARTLEITDEGRRVVDHWIVDLLTRLSAEARLRVVDSLRWFGSPTAPIDVELEGHHLVRCRLGGHGLGMQSVDFTWRTDLCLALARALTKAGDR